MLQDIESFTWADAWILLAIFRGEQRTKPVDLRTIIEVGDFLNHAILTRGELEHGLRRLIQAGHVTAEGSGYRVSERVRSLRLVRDPLEIIREFIGAPAYELGYRPPSCDSEQYVTADAYQRAVDDYTGHTKT